MTQDEQSGPPYEFTIGVGMPGLLHLECYGYELWQALGEVPFLVGSAATSKTWRDVDVRMMLPDDEYDAWFDEPDGGTRPQRMNLRWSLACAAYSELGRARTGLPVDFQFQRLSWANEQYGGKIRIPLGIR